MKLKEVKQKDLKVGNIARPLLPTLTRYKILSITKDSLTGLPIVGYRRVDEDDWIMLRFSHNQDQTWYLEVPSLLDRIVKFFKG